MADHGEIPGAQGDGINLFSFSELQLLRLHVDLAQEHPDIDDRKPEADGQQDGRDHPGLRQSGEKRDEGKSAEDQGKNRRPDPSLSQPEHIKSCEPAKGFFIQLNGNHDILLRGHTFSSLFLPIENNKKFP